MIDVVIYSENHFLNVGLASLYEKNTQQKTSEVYKCQSFLSLLRLAKKVKFVFFDEGAGFEQTKKKVFIIKKINPELKVFSLNNGEEYNLNCEAKGYIDKKQSFKYRSLREIAEEIQEIDFSTPALNIAFDYTKKSGLSNCITSRLTRIEFLVLELILKGKCNSKISTILNITPKITSFHRRNLFKKMNVRSIVQLVNYIY